MCRIIPLLLLVIALASSISPSLAGDPPLTQLLEQAIYQEQAVGDLRAALDIYQRIAKAHEKSERVAAEAQLHIGLIHLKLGEHATAADVLQQLADEYPAQRKLIHQARVEMPPVITEAIEKIRANYVEEIGDEVELTEAALRGVLGNLDRYSSFLDAKDLQNLSIGSSGRLVGIGAILEITEGRIVVTAPIPGSPAEEAGVKAGDTIVSVNDQSVDAFDEEERMTEVLNQIRGKAGESVKLDLLRQGSNKPQSIEIGRREVQLDSITGTKRNKSNTWRYRLENQPEIGYIRIKFFTESSPEELRSAVKELQQHDIESLIIDLRGNGGGMMNSTIEMADMFLDEGTILEVRGRHQNDKTFKADAVEYLKGIPIALLVNRDTASAAEIFAGSLQESGRAVVIGERTHGKGTVQALFPLRSGGAIKLTIARFYLSNGASLDKPVNPSEDDTWGVNPNDGLEIRPTDDERQSLADYRNAVDRFGHGDHVEDRAIDTAIDAFGHVLEN